MKLSLSTQRFASQMAVALLVVLFAATANAATFSVATSGSNLTYQTGGTVLPIVGNLPTASGGVPSLQWRPNGYPTIMGTGSNPVSLTIMSGLINKAGYTAILPIPSLSSYVQFTTGLGAMAPATGSTANFFPGAKTSRPANFNWCPNAAANPACTTVLTGGSQGDIAGIVKYTAGASQFGGTMRVLNTGPFSWYSVVSLLPTYKVRLNNEAGGTATIAAGPGYSNYVLETAGAGDRVFASPPLVPTYYGAYNIITNPGTEVSTLPNQASYGWGFPFTTGMVYIQAPALGSAAYQTISGTGADNRTPAGVGNISMVAGGLLTSPGGTTIVPQIVTFTMNVPEPRRVALLGSGIIGLIGLAAYRRLRA